MAYGGWREERYLAADADTVFEHLVGLLQHIGFEIQRAEPAVRGVTAVKPYMWSWWAGGPARIAAGIDPAGDSRSRIIIDSAPAYHPLMFGERGHQKNVKYILGLLEESLAS